jgi:hypothetical protein
MNKPDVLHGSQPGIRLIALNLGGDARRRTAHTARPESARQYFWPFNKGIGESCRRHRDNPS